MPQTRCRMPSPKQRASIFNGSFMGTKSSGCSSRPNQPPKRAPQITVEMLPKRMTMPSLPAKPWGLASFMAISRPMVSTRPYPASESIMPKKIKWNGAIRKSGSMLPAWGREYNSITDS